MAEAKEERTEEKKLQGAKKKKEFRKITIE